MTTCFCSPKTGVCECDVFELRQTPAGPRKLTKAEWARRDAKDAEAKNPVTAARQRMILRSQDAWRK